MTRLASPSPRQLAVPGIGFPQSIPIDPHPETFRDWSGAVQDGKTNDARMQLIDCIPWRSSSWPWSSTRSP
jgi:hypothetical protein